MEAFEKHFPDYSSSDDKLRVLDEDEMKSAQGKKRWRDFMMPFECVFSSLSRRESLSPFSCVGWQTRMKLGRSADAAVLRISAGRRSVRPRPAPPIHVCARV